MRWCVVIRALNTTTQLLFAVLSKSVSANCGIFTFISFVHCIRSKLKEKKIKALQWITCSEDQHVILWFLHWQFILEVLTSVLCLRNNWSPLHSLLRFTTFYWNTPCMNFKGISIILWSHNISSINNLFIKMEPKLICESQCELAGCVTFWMLNARGHSI